MPVVALFLGKNGRLSPAHRSVLSVWVLQCLGSTSSATSNGAPYAMSGQYEWKLGQQLPVLGAHSVAKHDIFEQYLGIYIERLTRTPSQTMLNLTIVDGFSGGGLYRPGSSEVDGSPLRLLR